MDCLSKSDIGKAGDEKEVLADVQAVPAVAT